MVRLKDYKIYTQDKIIEKLPLPKKVYIPLIQHLGKACEPEVNVGDLVFTGQRIASVKANVYAPIHASISGKVVGIQDWPHPVLGRAKTIIIESGGEDKTENREPRTEDQIRNLSSGQIRNIILESGIVGLGGAGFPTHIKLNPPKPVDTLIINGAECEPYLTSDYRLMLEKTDKILLGIELVIKCLGVKKVFIAIEENKPEAIKVFNRAIRNTLYAIRILKSYYPQGSEKQLIKNILNKEVPSGKLPFDVGVVVHNVGTIFAIYEAVYLNKPLYERVVTVSGSCLVSGKNLLVRLGTAISELINFCGLKEAPKKIIIGGPMMGIAQYTDAVPVIKTTSGVILMSKEELNIKKEESCIRCGACVRACPMGLMPCLINLAVEKELGEELKSYSVLDCIECGLCSYVCPANRNLVQSIKRAKWEVAK